ncbi:MAG: coproporphyrinogen dehydrogenase, partial [Candidatus Eisenbacteria bacterium]|nr:coproporphyrinogen dehydrogenase [Candidatus Eisenbacteria bacterium]
MTEPHDASAPLALADRGVTIDLIERYDQPGPRYTSYPTAVEFADGMTPEVYAERLAEANRHPDDPLSMYLHLPFCEERCLFCGCHVIITPHYAKAAPYLDLLRKEIDLVADRLPDRRGFSQLHLGGGTPTYYQPDDLGALLDYLLERFHPVPGAELAVECDPRVTTVRHLDVLAARGFNRISFGVQDFTPQVQEAISRIQTVEQTRQLLEHARSLGYRGINVDLIYGLPFQTPETFEESIETVIAMRPDRAAVYSFAFVPWIKGNQKRIEEE